MNVEQIKRTTAEGGRVYGTLIVSPSPHWPTYLRKTGLDFVFIDTEHISLDRHTLSWMCQAYAAANLAPIVRIPSPDPVAACQALDGGAAGIVAPYVETVEQAQALRGAVKLRPIKGQKLLRVLDDEGQLDAPLKTYLADYNRDTLLLVNIESEPALENLDEILSSPGLDGILLGPHDLSCSLGVPEQYEHPQFKEAIRMIAKRTRNRGLIAGAHFMCSHPVDLAIEWLKMGYNLHIHRADILFFTLGLVHDLNDIRRALGETFQSEAKSVVV